MQQTWYTTGKCNLDKTRPIFAENVESGVKLLLLPQMGIQGYLIRGYNWFNLKTGSYNSCTYWSTPEEAIKYYEKEHIFYNADITVQNPFKQSKESSCQHFPAE